MYVTIDTSALIAVIGNEESKKEIITVTKGYSLCAPKSVERRKELPVKGS